MKKILFCLKLQHLTGPCKGAEGYHSIWATKEAAERQMELRNRLHGNQFRYFVVEQKPETVGSNFYNKSLVKFSDSMGFLSVLS